MAHSGKGAGASAKWDEDSLAAFYDALGKHGQDWDKVAADVDRGGNMCEKLFCQFKTFLSLAHNPALVSAFVAMVKDHYNNLKEEPGEGEGVDQAHGGDGEGDERSHGAGNDAHAGASAELKDDGNGQGAEEADDEGTSNLVSQRSKRTPKPTAKALASPLSKRGAAGMSPKSGRVKSPEAETGSARKRRQRRLFSDEGEDPPQGAQSLTRWKAQHRHDDLGDGVDALLSLATIAHTNRPASSMDEARPQASVTPAATEPSGAEDRVGTAAMDEEGAGAAGAGEEDEGEEEDEAQGASAAARKPPRGTPAGGAKKGKSAATRASPKRQSGGKGSGSKGGRAAVRTSGRAKKGGAGGRKRGGAYASGSSDEDGVGGSDVGDGAPATVPMARASSAASQLPRSAGAGEGRKRGAAGDSHHGGSHKRQAAQHSGSGGAPPDGEAPAVGPDGVMLLDGNELFDLTGGLPLPHNLLAIGLDGLPLPPVSACLRSGTGLPFIGRTRRRKPAPERMPLVSPALLKSLLPQPGGSSGGGAADGGGPEAGGAGVSSLRLPSAGGNVAATPTVSSAAAAAAAAALSPNLLGSPGFLQGLTAPSLADHLLSPSESALRHALSSPRVRRWAAMEFQCSALDRPWFLRNELSELLALLCGGAGMPVPARLTRPEWSMLRSAFGRPRRVSLQFLKEERVKLEAYREHVRRVYDEAVSGQEVPAELPRPLRVGQAVVARHPITRQLHDGTVLTVTGFKCRVQFNRSELMTEMVRDVDIMPIDPFDNLPINIPITPAVLNGRPRPTPGVPRRRVVPRLIPRGAPADTGRLAPGPVPGGDVDGPPHPSDDVLAAEVSKLLEEKEVLVARLRELNDEAEAAPVDEASGQTHHAEAFQEEYSKVVLDLKALNLRLDPLLARLSGRSRHLSAASAGGSGGGGGGGGGPGGGGGAAAGPSGHQLNSPIAAIPPGSALAPFDGVDHLALGSFGVDGGAAGAMTPDGRAGAGGGATTSGGEPMSARAAGREGGGEAAGIVSASLGDARAVVERFREARERGRADADAAARYAGGDPSSSPLSGPTSASVLRLVTGCIAMLFTVQQCTAETVAPPAVEQALDAALRMLQPSTAANEDKLALIAENVRLLKAQLGSKS